MECIELRPEKEQKTMWCIGWTVPCVIGVGAVGGGFAWVGAVAGRL